MTKWLIAVIALFSALTASAQLAQPLLQPRVYFVDGSGNPCVGCSLYSYAAGTTTPQPTYTSASESSQNTNPVILDSTGSATVWMGSSSYKFALLDTFGTTLWTVDQVTAPLSAACWLMFLPLAGGTLTGSVDCSILPVHACKRRRLREQYNLLPAGDRPAGYAQLVSAVTFSTLTGNLGTTQGPTSITGILEGRSRNPQRSICWHRLRHTLRQHQRQCRNGYSARSSAYKLHRREHFIRHRGQRQRPL